MKESGIDMGNLKDFISNIDKVRSDFMVSSMNALTEFGGEIQRYSVTLTPIDTGNLRAAAYTGKAKTTKSGITIEVGYEKDILPENAYAAAVHERTDVSHDVGQAKFLETSLQTKEPDYLPYMRSRIKEDMGL